MTQVLDLKGKKVGDLKLDESVFGVGVKMGAMHSHVVRELANARAGTASSLTRTEVRGGGRKPWRQKGTGNARSGSTTSPLWNGGGVVFGPKPRSYERAMNQKARATAVRSALSVSKDKLVVVKNFEGLSKPKTKEFAGIMKDLELTGKKVLVVLSYATEQSKTVELAARNVARVKVVRATNLSVRDLLDADSILTDESTLEAITDRFKGKTEAERRATVKKFKSATKGIEALKNKVEKKAPAVAKVKEFVIKPKKEPSEKKEKAPKEKKAEKPAQPQAQKKDAKKAPGKDKKK